MTNKTSYEFNFMNYPILCKSSVCNILEFYQNFMTANVKYDQHKIY